MNISVTRFYHSLVGLALIMGGYTSLAFSSPGDLPNSPLFVTNSAAANVFFEVDDSGSMDFDILTKEHWQACAYRGGNNTCGFLVQDGTYYGPWGGDTSTSTNNYSQYIFITNETDNAYIAWEHCNAFDWVGNLAMCSSTIQAYDWRVKSSALNVLHYNPDITYLPWEKGDGTSMPDASFTAVRSDPQPGSTGYSVTRNLTGFVFNVWIDTHGFSGQARPTSSPSNQSWGGIGVTNTNGMVDWWDDHERYTVNTSSIAGAYIAATATSTTTTSTWTQSGGFNGRSLTEEKQNIANWYQYHRRRAFVTKAAIAKVISDNSDYRFGLNFINNSSFTHSGSNTQFVEMPATTHGSTTHNTALLQGLFDLDWQPVGTPLRAGLDRVGKYYDNTDGRVDPIIEQCQQNYSILFTDGYWNGSTSSYGSIANNDGDGYSISVADIAKYYYDKDLSSLNNNVVGSVFDPVDYQHMVTYTVAFGVTGNLVDTDADGWPGNAPGLLENSNWGDPFVSDSPQKIDDLWHAAYNSRGKFISATTPQELSDGLSDALSNIGDRRGSVASVAFSTASLSASSSVYLTQFSSNENEWSGDILAFSVNSVTGDAASSPSWSASNLLDAKTYTTRKIFTYNETTNLGVKFRWSQLANKQKDDLNKNPDNTVSDNTKGKARLAYLRGDRTNEELEGGGTNGTYTFRRRSHLLGDVVHSAPLYVGKPKQVWPDTAPFPDGNTTKYKAFKEGAAATRTPVIYVGANDGMLHGFKASNGAELLAYIPSFLFSSSSATSGVHYLTDPSYTHRYYMDMPLTIADAYFGSTPSWHTVLLGGGRAGGRGIFALDITTPSNFINTNAANIVLWEFDHTDDPALGFTYSQPTIALMNNGRWAAIFGNGYNSTDTGEAALFVVFLDGGSSGTWTEGTDYLKITTGAGSLTSGVCGSTCNGLSTPQPVDMDGDKVVDRVYAGDLQGNMWAFDVSNATASNWDVAYKSGATSVPLFKATYHETTSGVPSQFSATPQAITSKPILVKHPSKLGGDPDVLVFFGTGQYLVESDIANSDKQSFYGVWDNSGGTLSSALTPVDLVEQEFLSETLTNNSIDVTSQVRILTDNAVDYAGGKKGWFINLTLDTGERVVVDPDVNGDVVFFNTWVPSTHPCDPGGYSFLMSVKTLNGGASDEAIFDFDNDGDVDADDLVTNGGGTARAPSGQRFGGGLASSSSFLSDYQYTVGTEPDGENVSGSDINVRKLKNSSDGRRLSWQELRD